MNPPIKTYRRLSFPNTIDIDSGTNTYKRTNFNKAIANYQHNTKFQTLHSKDEKQIQEAQIFYIKQMRKLVSYSRLLGEQITSINPKIKVNKRLITLRMQQYDSSIQEITKEINNKTINNQPPMCPKPKSKLPALSKPNKSKNESAIKDTSITQDHTHKIKIPHQLSKNTRSLSAVRNKKRRYKTLLNQNYIKQVKFSDDSQTKLIQEAENISQIKQNEISKQLRIQFKEAQTVA